MKCPLCKDDLYADDDGVTISFNGLCSECARLTYIVWRDLHIEEEPNSQSNDNKKEE